MRVLIVADDPLVRSGLAVVLGAAGIALDAHAPEAVLWDLGADADVAAERAEEIGDAVAPVVALVCDATLAGEVLEAGARGILPRDSDGPTLAAALFAVGRGLVAIDVRFDGALARAPRRDAGGDLAELPEDLTRREHEVLQLLASGLANKEIARELGISEHTAKFHVNAILGKLGAESRTEAVVRAARLGLVIL